VKILSQQTLRNRPVRYAQDCVISFAQNREDVLLHRALEGKRGGFFVDVGAGSPVWDSVTHWFSRNGWTGINIEPSPVRFKELVEARKADVNLNVGIHSRHGTMDYYHVLQNDVGHGWGLSSFDPLMKLFAERRGFCVDVLRVQVLPLVSILDQHATGRVIDFMKIDVEGLELEVLKSCDFERHRPRILCIEALKPENAIPSFSEWEPIVICNGYQFAAFDGLNNYYVRDEDCEAILSQFLAPVNVHDHYRKGTIDDLT
jgi:FkbM family methyltransferase